MGLERNSKLNESKSKATKTATAPEESAVTEPKSAEDIVKDENSLAPSEKEAKVMATASRTSFSGFIEAGEEQGNTGMVLDRTSFPCVVLDGSDFSDSITKDPFELEGVDLSKKMLFQPMAWKQRITYTVMPEGAGKDDDGEFYVLMEDGETVHTDEKLADVLANAEADGATVTKKTYVDYIALVFAPDDEMMESPLGLASLSIPPASSKKVAGAISIYQAMNRVTVENPVDCLIEASVGKKVSKDKISYYPWAFKVIKYPV